MEFLVRSDVELSNFMTCPLTSKLEISYLSSGKWDVGHGISTALLKRIRFLGILVLLSPFVRLPALLTVVFTCAVLSCIEDSIVVTIFNRCPLCYLFFFQYVLVIFLYLVFMFGAAMKR